MFFSSQYILTSETDEEKNRPEQIIDSDFIADSLIDDVLEKTRHWCDKHASIFDGIEEEVKTIESLLPFITKENSHRFAKLLKRVACARMKIQDLDEDEEALLDTLMDKMIQHGIPVDKALFPLVGYSDFTYENFDNIGLLIEHFFHNRPVFLFKEKTINAAFINAIERDDETVISVFWEQDIDPIYDDAKALCAAILEMNLNAAERLIGMGAKPSVEKVNNTLLSIVKNNFVCLKHHKDDDFDGPEPTDDEWYSFAALRILVCFGANPNLVFEKVIMANNYEYLVFFKNLPITLPLQPEKAGQIFNKIVHRKHYEKQHTLYDFRILEYLLEQGVDAEKGIDIKANADVYLKHALERKYEKNKEKEIVAFWLANGAKPTTEMLVSACRDDGDLCRLLLPHADERTIQQALEQDDSFKTLYQGWFEQEWYVLRDVNEIVRQAQEAQRVPQVPQEHEQTEERMRDTPMRNAPESYTFEKLPLLNSILTQVVGRETLVRYRDYKRRMGEGDVEF